MGYLQGTEILVIDDAADIRLLVRKILEGNGAAVTEADSVKKAFELIDTKVPQLIITDLTMPEQSGFDFLRRCSAVAALQSVPTIVLSGLNDRDSVTMALALGATDYIIKPIRAPLLLQKVRKRLKSIPFLSREFSIQDQPKARVSLAAEVVSMSEVGLQLESPVKLTSNENVGLSGEILEKLALQKVLTRTAEKPEPHLNKGRFVSEVNFVGIGDAVAKDLRDRLKEWK